MKQAGFNAIRHVHNPAGNEKPLPMTIDGAAPVEVQVQGGILAVPPAGPVCLPAQVQFAWENYCEVGLCNSVGLPAFPFKIVVE